MIKYTPFGIVAVLLATGLPGIANAQAPQLRATALGGLERTDSAPGSGAVDGTYYGVQLGADWSLGPLLVGVEGDLGDSTASAALGTNRAKQGVFASGAVRLALPVTSGARVFVRGGYAYHEVSYDTGPAFRGSGFTGGGGAEVDLGQIMFVRAEYRYSDYGNTVRGQQFLGGLGIKF